MRIVIDMQGAQTESRFRGIGRYSTALTQAILRNAGEHEIWIILNSHFPEAVTDVRNSLSDLIPTERIVTFDVPSRISWENPENDWRRQAAELTRESFIAELQPDLVLISSLFEGANLCDAALSTKTLESEFKVAVILYDLIPLLDPDNYLGAKWIRDWYMDKIDNLKRANLLLSISEHSRREAIATLELNGERIVNISSAHTDFFRPRPNASSDNHQRLAQYGISRPFVMYNGALEPRKNLDRLIQGFSLLPPPIRDSHQLVFVGKVSGPDRERLTALAQSLKIDNQFVVTGYVNDEELATLFSNCAVFAFPSLHEGFGLPALEAMACGAATIGSNTTSIPEVIGRQDALFDPRNPEDIAQKMCEVLSNQEYLASLREHALAQASKFSWDICARRFIKAAEELVQKSSPPMNSTWVTIEKERADHYRQLINAIAKINVNGNSPSDVDLRDLARCIASNRASTATIARNFDLPAKINWRVEGPFDSSYSLSLLNRETACALQGLGHYVALHSTEGPGDFEPNPAFLRENPEISKLHSNAADLDQQAADVTSRNLYPPRVTDMSCRMNLLHHYAWEESGFPYEWTQDFNESLQGITCLSQHVKKILIDNGVTVPISVSGCGVDHWTRIQAESAYAVKAKAFRFLHVSSCFPRKGVDALLQAYGQAFTSDDDVSLIVKTFRNPHNEIHRLITEAKSQFSRFPDVIVIETDLTESELKALYEQSHVLVAPSRAEGFGLPLAEAMLSGLPVITTAWSGQLDFCNDETAWLVDYKFARAQTHFDLFDSVWAEPNVEHLAQTMRAAFQAQPVERDRKIRAAKELLLTNFKWSDAAKRLVSSARSWSRMHPRQTPRIGWVTTWNTRCGIATYSAHLVEKIPTDVTIFAARTLDLTQHDSNNVVRCWDTGESDSLKDLSNAIAAADITTLVIQFNYSLFSLESLREFLIEQLNAGRTIVITMHSTTDPIHILPHKRLELIKDVLIRCHRVLVHAPADLNRLKEIGLIENVALFPHGINTHTLLTRPARSHSTEETFTVASYGFFLPHKGLLELIDAIALLRKRGSAVRLNMINAEYPVEESGSLIAKARARIASLQLEECIELTTSFLTDAESLELLSDADLIVFPYQETGESASGAVRYGISVGRPVAVTPLSIFDDVLSAVHVLPGQTPELIAAGIERIQSDASRRADEFMSKQALAERWRAAHSYAQIGARMFNMLSALSLQD